MKLSFSKNWVALALSVTLSLGMTACSDNQSNEPLDAQANLVKLEDARMVYQTGKKVVEGTITTTFTGDANSSAMLSGFTATIADCTVNSIAIDTEATSIVYTDNEPKLSKVLITLNDVCTMTEVVLTATESNDANQTIGWSETIAVETLAENAIISPIDAIVPSAATTSIELTQNNESQQIILNIYDENNVPLSEGEIGVQYPTRVTKPGSDVGTLNPVDVVKVENGRAVFTYTGPSDLLKQVSEGNTSATFKFFDKANISEAVSITINFNPSTTTPPPVLTGYTVEFTNPDAKATVNLESTTVYTLAVKDDKGVLVPNADIVKGTITSLVPNRALFIDNASGSNVAQDFFKFDGKNNVKMTVETYTKSGLVPFKVDMQIRDEYGNILDKNITKAITVFSGPPTAMSISYANTEQDEDRAKFIEKMVISLTDEHSNPVNTQPTVSIAAITGYAVETGSGVGNNYMVRESAVGTVDTDGADGAKFDITTGDMTNADKFNNVLLTYGNGYTYQASGIWDIDTVTATSLTMLDKFSGSTAVAGMGYAIGGNIRQDICNFGQEWIGQVESKDQEFVVDSTGNALVDFRYDYMLTGKTIMFGASVVGHLNSTGETIRMGESIKHTLRGHTFDGSFSCSVGSGVTNVPCTVPVHITDTGYFARNINFSYTYTLSDELIVNVGSGIVSSMDDLYGCTLSSSGQAFVTVYVDNITVPGTTDAAAGTVSISITTGLVSGEF